MKFIVDETTILYYTVSALDSATVEDCKVFADCLQKAVNKYQPKYQKPYEVEARIPKIPTGKIVYLWSKDFKCEKSKFYFKQPVKKNEIQNVVLFERGLMAMNVDAKNCINYAQASLLENRKSNTLSL